MQPNTAKYEDMGVNGKLVSQDVETILYKILNVPELKSFITGSIYKDGYRPTNSGKEDISVSTLALSQEQPQIAVCNVNIHVPDLQQTMNHGVEYVPNSVKLKSLSERVMQIINEALFNPLYKDFSVRLDYQRTFRNQDTEAREHSQNLRIELIIPNN